MDFLKVITLFTWIYSAYTRTIQIKQGREIRLPSQKEFENNINCLTKPFDMPLVMEGCKKLTIRNNYCGGYCNSLFVPIQGTNKTRINECLFCRPENAYERIVILKCGDVLKPIKVTIVKKCICGACHKKKRETD